MTNQFHTQHYLGITTTLINGTPLTVWESTSSIDNQWDTFLSSSPYGHFYQSSMWAQVRILEGWNPLITLITSNQQQVIAGFQILWSIKPHLGKVGLLLKGPVVDSDDPLIMDFVITVLKQSVKAHKIKALIVQPPDKDQNIHESMSRSGFSTFYLDYIIKDNTVVIDLDQKEESLFKAMKHNKRKNIKTASRVGVSVREGNENDISTFFNYMTETCKRQQVKPSPSNIEFIEKMWNLFSHNGNIKLFLSVYQEKDLSALMVILFGPTAYLWKFGWSGDAGSCRPNEILYFEAFKWARMKNYHLADMGYIDSQIAKKIWNHESIPEEFTKSYSFFKAGFGGNILPLSRGLIYIPNPIIRIAYNFLMPYINSKPALKKLLLSGE